MAERRTNYILSHGNQGGGGGASKPPAKAQQGQKTEKKPKRKEPGLRIFDGNLDMLFFAVVIVLLVYGIIMMFSASYIAGLSESNDGYKYVRTQGMAAVVGVVMMIFISFFDYHILMNSKVVLLGFVVALAMMFMVFLPEPIGYSVAGAHRWIKIGSTSFQPSELMKPVLVVFFAYLLSRELKVRNPKKDMWRYIVILSIVCGTMVLQRHMSGLLLMGVISYCVLYVGGVPIKTLIKMFLILLAAGAVVAVIATALRLIDLSYVLDRFTGMSSADSGDITDESWQTSQSLIAIGSGGWFGLGFGESKQKYLWLPESQNDFIISVIVEELGYLGGLVVIILFGLLIYRGFYIAKKAPDKFGMLITVGITFQIGVQALLNIGVACNAFPNTGISLPFFSSGGTALLIQLAEMGVILGVSRQCEI